MQAGEVLVAVEFEVKAVVVGKRFEELTIEAVARRIVAERTIVELEQRIVAVTTVEPERRIEAATIVEREQRIVVAVTIAELERKIEALADILVDSCSIVELAIEVKALTIEEQARAIVARALTIEELARAIVAKALTIVERVIVVEQKTELGMSRRRTVSRTSRPGVADMGLVRS